MNTYSQLVLKLIAISVILVFSVQAQESMPPGKFSNDQCISCHLKLNPELVKQSQHGPHTSKADVNCISCHGDEHVDASNKARQDEICIQCHEGTVSHSYSTSKHGVLIRLEGKKLNWELPLQRGNYRAPGCSYCHLHDGNHGDSMSSLTGDESIKWVCSGCHSPRYIRELIANGARQLEVADLKVKEGMTLIEQFNKDQKGIGAGLIKSLKNHQRNVLLGVGHQSPDYQWWHGQPALDGDLIRIRDVIGKMILQ